MGILFSGGEYGDDEYNPKSEVKERIVEKIVYIEKGMGIVPEKSKQMDERFLTTLSCMKNIEARRVAKKIYDNFDITNVFWDANKEEVEFIGNGFSVTIADV